jgi:phosphomannomutase
VNQILVKAAEWMASDVDQGDIQEMQSLVDRANAGDAAAMEDLASRLSGPLQFGTAGLRGAMGAGPARMNRAVVTRAAAGVMAYLHDKLDGKTPHVVIGFDGRRGSIRFAMATAAVVVAAGGRASLF